MPFSDALQHKLKSDDRTTARAAATPQGAGRSGAAEQRAVDGPRGGPGGGPVWGQTLPWYVALCISTMPLLAASVIQTLLTLCTQSHTRTAVILALDEGKAEAAIKFYGYPDVESKPLSDLSALRPTPGGELGPGEATVGFECEVRAGCGCGRVACVHVVSTTL